MKKIVNLIVMAGMIGLAAASCQKPDTNTPDGGKTDGGLTAPTLTADPVSVVVDPDSEEVALAFAWNDVSANGITPKYSLQLTKKGDTEFSAGTAYDCDGLDKSFNHAEVVALASEIGASVDEGFTLVARVRVTAEGVSPVFSNVAEVNISKTQYAIENIYPIGNGTPYGWSQDNTVAMDKNGTTFTWTGHLYANADIKFLLQNDGNWWPGIVNKSDDPFTFEPIIGYDDSVDKKFKVREEGKYTITIDAANTNALKLKMEFIDKDEQTLVVEHLYLLGDATPAGWSLDAMPEFTKAGDVFTWEGPLTEGGEFRFPMQRDWWPCLMIAMDGETLVKGVGDDDKTGFTVDESAIYKIECNVATMKAKLTKTGDIVPPDFPTVYMCGDATPYGWSSNMTDESQLKPVDTNNVNVLSWTGALTASGAFKFLTKNDWIPSYNRDENASDYWTLILRETYDDPDVQFQVSEDGTYKVTVDLDAMKVTCTKQ